MEDANGQPLKILILGSQGHGKNMDSYLWSELPPKLNVADYDVLVMNFSTEGEDGARMIQTSFENLPSVESFARTLFGSKSTIFVIGSPDFDFVDDRAHIRSGYWMPTGPAIKIERGDTITEVRQDFETYFDHVKSWEFCAQLDHMLPYGGENNFLAALAKLGQSMKASAYSVAENKYGYAIGYQIEYEISDLTLSGEVYWLPFPTEISPFDAINLLLREIWIARRKPTS